jgi:hypothetical protein
MISFTTIGIPQITGYLGNNMFQYAFLRSKAHQLGVPYSLPNWKGENIFELNEGDDRLFSGKGCNQYTEPANNTGYNSNTESIQDNTEVFGYFQTEKYFHPNVKKWLEFKKDIKDELDKKYSHVDFNNSTSIHLRLGDYLSFKHVFCIQEPKYYDDAMNELGIKDVLVFTNDHENAKKILSPLNANFIWMSDPANTKQNHNKDYEDLYLMTKCRNNIIANSSYSWWGAYLNKHEDKKIVAPKRWFNPTGPIINNDIYCRDWVTV